MKNNKLFPYLMVFSLLLLTLVVLVKKPDQIFKPSKTRVIETRVEGNKRLVDSIVVHEKTIRTQLNEYKTIEDTVMIVQYQDSLITILDTQIVVLNSIVKDQDTIISVLKYDSKRLRRQRNISLIGNAVLGSILILKK